mgnify:CR=1 FL=1
MRSIDSSDTTIKSSSTNSDNDEFLHVIYDYTGKDDDELTLKYLTK